MQPPPHTPVRVAATADGTPIYLSDIPPEALPPVRLRDLSAAWDAARSAAIAASWGAARLFRFRRDDGNHTDMSLADPDACCWAGAVDCTMGLNTSYGLSLCLRLLALVDLLGRASWAAAHFAIRRDGADIHPSLLHTAATSPLTREGRFDEQSFRHMLQSNALPAPRPSAQIPPTLRSGATA